MKKWTMRILGGLNILQFPAGTYYTAVLVSWHWRHWPTPPSNIYWFFFFLFFGINFALTALLAYLGWRLIRGDERAILITSLVLFMELGPSAAADEGNGAPGNAGVIERGQHCFVAPLRGCNHILLQLTQDSVRWRELVLGYIRWPLRGR